VPIQYVLFIYFLYSKHVNRELNPQESLHKHHQKTKNRTNTTKTRTKKNTKQPTKQPNKQQSSHPFLKNNTGISINNILHLKNFQ